MFASLWPNLCPQSAELHGYPLEKVVEALEDRVKKSLAGNEGNLTPKEPSRNLIIVDACRSASRGMRGAGDATESPRWGETIGSSSSQTLVCRACRHLSEAEDGAPGKNGVYTGALLKVGGIC